MRVGIYLHNLNMKCHFMAKELEQKGAEVTFTGRCLCKSKLEEGLAIILIHPDDTNRDGCWEKIIEYIRENPLRQFYIISFNKPQRIQAIGEHPNVAYITERNIATQVNALLRTIENN